MERIDDIGFSGYKLVQDTEGFCYGVDAVVLADFCKASKDDIVLDMCTGNGIVPLILESKFHPQKITGIEIQLSSYLLAERNARDNGLSNKIDFIFGDAKNIQDFFPAESFSLVSCNPPYFEKGRGVESELNAKHIARHETSAVLEDFIRSGAYALKKGGRLCMVHRPSRLPDIFEFSRKYGMEPKRLLMLAPHIDEAANIMLIECVKGGGKELKLMPQIYVRNYDGTYSDEINKIYER